MNRQEVLAALRSAGTFYLATAEITEHGAQPRVRPYGFVMEYEGRLCFATNEHKPTYAQLEANPYVELCAMTSRFAWLRVSGRAVKITSEASRNAALAAMPALRQNYAVYGGDFDVFALEDAVADSFGFGQSGIEKTSEKI